jgi:hypothetical protein
MHQPGSYGAGSGYGYAGTGLVGNRTYTPSQYSNQSRGRAGSVSSRGTSGVGFYSGQSHQGYRGGGGGERGGGRGAGNRGLPGGSTCRDGNSIRTIGIQFCRSEFYTPALSFFFSCILLIQL